MLFLRRTIYICTILSAADVLNTQGASAAAIMPESADSPSASAVAHAALDGIAINNGSGISGTNRLTCAQSMLSVDHLTDEEVDGDMAVPTSSVTQMPYVTCEDASKYCYALWHEDVVNGTARIVMMGQGCWETSGKPDDCERNECVNGRKPSDDKKFCCCLGDMCNANVTNPYGPNYVEDIVYQNNSVVPCAAISDKNMPYILLYGLITAIPICMLLIVCICWYHKQKKKNDVEMGVDQNIGGSTSPSVLLSADHNFDKLKLTDIVIGEGRYGRVLKASLGSGENKRDVAVKVFPADHRNYCYNEYELYRVAGEHPHLVRCFGKRSFGERSMVDLTVALQGTTNNQLQYFLILSLEKESLQEYLTRDTVDMNTLCRMTLGIAKGLAHLHCDLGKQCIAHRDLNTKNILVTSDLNCRICDLGLAVIPRRTENKVLSEAGTLRYMAPEVLEGAVNLRDCESALRQIDVYALGLVLWEVASRCAELQDNVEPEPYAPPFHRELRGATPSLEHMQTLVTKHKARPLWPSTWCDATSAAARLLRETTEDCWDQDAEARLTSLCVEERLLELPTLRGRGVGGICGHPHHVILASPTALINNNHLHDQHTNVSVSANSVGSGDGGFSSTHIGSLTTIEASVGTVDTLLSPSGEDNNCKNSNRVNGGSILPYGNGNIQQHQSYINRLTAPLNQDNYIQPYQGRNPCMERNLLSESSDSPLIDKSAKHNTSSETQNLLKNDFLNAINQRNPRAMPIPYLQNAVHATSDNQSQNRPSKHNSMAANAKTNKFINFRGLKKFFHTKKDQGNLSLLKDTQVRMIPSKLVNSTNNYGQNGVTISLLRNEENAMARRPTTLTLASSASNVESKPTSAGVSQLLRAAAASEQHDKGDDIENNLLRQRSLEQFSEVFTSVTDLSRLKDPSARVKTPGDVPASVRRTRGKAAKQSITRFSLYDDRMMTQWGSAPDLEPSTAAAGSSATTISTVSARTSQVALKPPMLGNIQVRDSVTSF